VETLLDNGIHFISGLPRAGSTLLAALLRQNPRCHAGMTCPVGSLFTAVQRQMSQEIETSVFISDVQRARILRMLFDAYYGDIHPTKLVFDTNRLWCSKLPALTELFPSAKVICCVRHVPWIIDSIERLVRANRFEPSKIFNFDPGGTVYSRVEALGSGSGMVGFAWNALREAFYGEQSDRIVLLTYESLIDNPAAVMASLYDFIGEPNFVHDFKNIEFDADEFDARLGAPGLHAVGRAVRRNERQTILPSSLFRRVEPDSFWRDPAQNLRGVRII